MILARTEARDGCDGGGGYSTGARYQSFSSPQKKTMKRSSHLLADVLAAFLPLLALGLPGVASAIPVTLTSPSVAFSDPAPVSGSLANSNIHWPDANHDEVRFGVPTGNSNNPSHQQSGLRFDVFPVGSSGMTVNTGDIFKLGTLSHFNWEVQNGTSITGATLTFAFGVKDGVPETFVIPFALGVNETDNNKAGCANAPTPATNWCPDIISFPNMGGSTNFVLNGQTLTLNLLGFGPTAGEYEDTFITQEFKNNFTYLWASISAPSTQVPEPGSLLMLALGLFGLGGLQSYRQKRKSDKRQG